MPDFIVIDLDLLDGITSDFINYVFSGNLGMNPFIPIIAVNWDANMESVKPAVDAGVDDLLAAPLSVKAFLGRIEGLVKDRKPSWSPAIILSRIGVVAAGTKRLWIYRSSMCPTRCAIKRRADGSI